MHFRPHYRASKQKVFIPHAFPESSNLLPTKHKGIHCSLCAIIIIIISYLYEVCLARTYVSPSFVCERNAGAGSSTPAAYSANTKEMFHQCLIEWTLITHKW